MLSNADRRQEGLRQKTKFTKVPKVLDHLPGDRVQASYGMSDGSTAYFASCRNAGNKDDRFAVQIFGTEGVIEIMTNYMASVKFLPDPTWSPGRSGKAWQEVSSAGIDQPEPITKKGTGEGNRVAILDLLAAAREDREPLLWHLRRPRHTRDDSCRL